LEKFNLEPIIVDYLYSKQEIVLNSETYIKHFVAGWADKKPFGDTALFFEHRMKTIFVSTRRANLKLVFHLNVFNFVIHTIDALSKITSFSVHISIKSKKANPVK